ncbi:SulP family inorganic anion transporter, partial [Streptomyces scabiei]|nr:SulP family inorganic anion transporter [Streptomyces scabiei]
LMPDLTGVPAAAERSVDVPEDPAGVWDYATVGSAAVGGTGGRIPPGPGPDAEWFYLDTRPLGPSGS